MGSGGIHKETGWGGGRCEMWSSQSEDGQEEVRNGIWSIKNELQIKLN